MCILFMGTPDIAAISLQAILSAGHSVCGVFTREDKPVGRKRVLTAPPVKQLALQHDIPVFQPKTLRTPEATQQIATLAPELIVVVAYGRILPPEILEIPEKGCINLHVSLLPKYRGSAPVQWAVINGETETGVSIMYLDEGLDTGDILKVSPVTIGEEETSGELFDRIAEEGAKTLLACMDEIAAGTALRTPQNHSEATLAPPLTKAMARFSFNAEAEVLHNLVRGMNPWPVAYFELEDKKVKVLNSRVRPMQGTPGTVLALNPLTIACGKDALELYLVVPEGAKPMSGNAFAAGRRLKVGDTLTQTGL